MLSCRSYLHREAAPALSASSPSSEPLFRIELPVSDTTIAAGDSILFLPRLTYGGTEDAIVFTNLPPLEIHSLLDGEHIFLTDRLDYHAMYNIDTLKVGSPFVGWGEQPTSPGAIRHFTLVFEAPGRYSIYASGFFFRKSDLPEGEYSPPIGAGGVIRSDTVKVIVCEPVTND